MSFYKKFKGPTVRLPARQAYPFKHDADLKSITRILSARRAPNTASFDTFVQTVIEPVFGAPDQFGNYALRIGDAKHAFVAHSDTVEHKNGRVSLHVDANQIISVAKHDTTSACLGADCGAGIWLILEMIKADRPGLYLICAEEESGCHGASALATHRADLFEGIESAIEFDRHDKAGNEVITCMVAGPTASDDYAQALCALLGLGYTPSEDGLLTDVMEFMDLLPNVTNITVGYQGHHSAAETLDFAALRKLRDVLITVDFSLLPSTPKPPKPVYTSFMADLDYNWAMTPSRGRRVSKATPGWPDHDTWAQNRENDLIDEMTDMIAAHPFQAATLLRDLGVDIFELIDHIDKR
jgi:hypothetical protein